MRCSGQGDVFLAERAYDVRLLNLADSGLSISGQNVLAFSSNLDWNIERVKGGSIATGGLFNTTLRGTGSGRTDHRRPAGGPRCRRGSDVRRHQRGGGMVGRSASAAENSFEAGALIGRGSGEAVQVSFYGDGLVIVQPSEGVQIATTQ